MAILRESFTFLKVAEPVLKYMSTEQKKDLVEQLTDQMYQAAKDLEFERAASIRDEISHLKKTIK